MIRKRTGSLLNDALYGVVLLSSALVLSVSTAAASNCVFTGEETIGATYFPAAYAACEQKVVVIEDDVEAVADPIAIDEEQLTEDEIKMMAVLESLTNPVAENYKVAAVKEEIADVIEEDQADYEPPVEDGSDTDDSQEQDSQDEESDKKESGEESSEKGGK